MHIAIAGNIGSGKTTLTSLLAKHFKWEPHMKMWLTIRTSMISITKWNGGHLIYRFTLNSRFRQVIHIRGKKVIQDRNDL
jgi:Ni2+-binding GTPase involved in maturation of urease and hydrogenase